MKIDSANYLANMNALIRREVDRAVESILESSLSPEDDERKRQDSVSKEIDSRHLRASDSAEEVEEAEEDTSKKPDTESQDSDKDPKDQSKRKDRTGGKGTADSNKANTPAAEDLKNPSLGDLVDKLNIMRGGKSLKDPDVKRSFEDYLGTLNIREKQTMLIFLTAISQILVGKKRGAEALDPSEVGLRIKAQQKPRIPKNKKPTSTAGTSTAPIVVGESQDKAALKKMIEAYRRHS